MPPTGASSNRPWSGWAGSFQTTLNTRVPSASVSRRLSCSPAVTELVCPKIPCNRWLQTCVNRGMGNIAMLQVRRPGPMTVDKELIQRCQQGDQDAFESLVKKHERRVFGLVYQMVRQPSEVEDIAQEVFTKIYFSLPQFRIEASFEAWLYRITVNQCYDYLRKRKREAQVTESDLSDEEAAFFERFGSITQIGRASCRERV